MFCRDTSRPALLVVLHLCCSLLAVADDTVKVAVSSPPTKPTVEGPPGIQHNIGDSTEAAALRSPSDNNMLLLVDHDADTEKVVSKREDSPGGGMWFGPRMGRAVSEESLENAGSHGTWVDRRLGRSNEGMWLGPRMERAANNGASVDSGMWFGPRMGRATGGRSEGFEHTGGMWFGPRMGRSTTDGMEFGSRISRSLEFDSYNGDEGRQKNDNLLLVFRRQLPSNREFRDSPEAGMWFGPRMGRTLTNTKGDSWMILKKRSRGRGREESAVEGMWFGPRMGRKREADWEEAGRKERGPSDGMWFGPRLG